VNRALRAATMGVLLLSPVVLGACSAGQVTQTESQVRDKTGAQARVGDIFVRQAQLLSPRSGTYEQGDDADLQVALVNSGTDDDTLVGVEGEGFGAAEIENASTGSASSSASRGSAQELELPAGTSVFVGGDDADATITLTDLDEGLTPGQYLEITLTFEKAGEVTLPISVANPSGGEHGEAFDFHEEEGTEAG
jgi:copper(I)-binding protein